MGRAVSPPLFFPLAISSAQRIHSPTIRRQPARRSHPTDETQASKKAERGRSVFGSSVFSCGEARDLGRGPTYCTKTRFLNARGERNAALLY